MKANIKSKLRWFLNSFIWLGVIFLILDIVSKNVIVANKDAIMQSGGIPLIPGFLRINYTINNHIVFGLDLFKNDIATRIVFVVVALGISAGIIVFLIKKWGKVNRFYKACLMMILAGAIGNSIDRIFYSTGYLSFYSETAGRYITGVVDWIDFYGVWKFNFNIADIAVVVAAFMLVIYMIVTEIIAAYRKHKAEPKKVVDHTRVMSKTEQENSKYIEKKESKDE